MAEIEAGKPRIKQRSSSTFISSCFGYSRVEDDGDQQLEIIESGSGSRRKRGSASISPFKCFQRENSGTRTVPLDNLTFVQRSQKKNVENDRKPLKSDAVAEKLRQVPVNFDPEVATVQPVEAFLSDQQVPAGKSPKLKYETAQSAIFDTVKDDPSQKKSLLKQKSELAHITNRPDSPSVNNFMNRQSSLPPPARSQPAVRSTGRTLRRKSSRKDDTLAGRFEPAVGLSVLVVVLAIMVLWGKLCAILCTSAWFYFVPCFRRIMKFTEAPGGNYKPDHSGKLDLDSNAYKKKVILEGLLERKRRNNTGIS